MHIVVVGCGRVGSSVARELMESGHTVCVVDRNESAFRRLGSDFAGRTLRGIGFDRETLREAGVTPDVAVAAVTSGDNSNILTARVAREVFGAQRVVARIYDPKRAAIYERLGLATVASVAWTSSRVLHRLLPDSAADWTDPTGAYSLIEHVIPGHLAGVEVGVFERELHVRVAVLSRDGAAVLPEPTAMLQDGDVIHVLVTTEDAAKVTAHVAQQGAQ
jgi:trk system potassium uptake protein